MISRIKRAIDRKVLWYLDHVTTGRQIQFCNVRDSMILVGVESDIERYRANTYATKEPETLDWIERYFRRGEVIYDVGANVGLYSLFAAKHLKGDCKVYAFEPEALNHARLSKNVYLNGLSSVVIPCCLAITDRLCFDLFYLNPHNFETAVPGEGLVPGSALHNFGAPVDELRQSGSEFRPLHRQGTVGVSIDHMWKEWGLDFPNHIKIDVDGLEEKIVAGSAETLKDERLRSVLVEIASRDEDANTIPERLTEAGFVRVADFPAHSSELLEGTRYEGFVNHVFVRE